MKKGRYSSLFCVISSVLIASQPLHAESNPKGDSKIVAASKQVAEDVNSSYPKLMAMYGYYSLFKLDLMSVYEGARALESIDNPDIRNVAKGLTYAVPLALSGYGAFRVRSEYKVAKPEFQKAYTKMGKAGAIWKRVTWKNLALASALWVVWENTPILFLNKDDYDLLVMTTETNIQTLQAALEAKARNSYLVNSAEGSGSKKSQVQTNAELFKLEE